MTDVKTLGKLTDQHSKSRDTIIEALIKALLGLWGRYNYWSDADITTGMAARSADLVDTATARVRLLERSYLSTVLRQFDASPPSLPPIVNGYPRANVTAVEAYRRPVERFLWARSNGVPFAEATDEAIARLEELAERDVLTAARDEDQIVFAAAPKVLGYRRVIHPELSKTGTCGLCVAAAGRVYKSGELLDLHGGDNCDVLPIVEGDDPGYRLNEDDLKQLYAAAGSTAAEDLVNVRVTIKEHGELGPILVKQGDHFRTPAEAGRPEYVAQTPATIRADRERELSELKTSAEAAQRRYDQYVTARPETLEANSDNGERIALFRSIQFMRERTTSLERFLSALPN